MRIPVVLIPDCQTGEPISSDCDACSVDSAFASVVPADPQTRYGRAAGLYVAGLRPGYHVAFNPLAAGGPAVLNDVALELLTAYHEPRRPGEASEALTEANAAEGTLAFDRLRQAGLLLPVDQAPEPGDEAPSTLTAWLHVTNACNLRCDYCYVTRTADEMAEATGRRAVSAVFQAALRHGFRAVHLKYAGGEATLNFTLVKTLHAAALEQAARTGLTLKAVLLSNGAALSRTMIAELKARRIRLMLSLDGVGEFHDAQRRFANGRGSFALVERGIRLALEVGLRPELCITVTRRNLAGLADATQYALGKRLPFNLNFYREADCAPEDLSLDGPGVIAAMRAAFAAIEADLPEERFIDRLVDRAQFDRPHRYPCGAGRSYVVFDHRGQVSPCHMLMGEAPGSPAAGDVLTLVQDDPRLRNLPVDNRLECAACPWRYWCAGGCPLATHRATGRWDLRSPNCDIYKALYPDLMRLEGLRLLKLAGLGSA